MKENINFRKKIPNSIFASSQRQKFPFLLSWFTDNFYMFSHTLDVKIR